MPLGHMAEAPFLRAPEGARTVFVVTLLAACAPLASGLVLFGWRAAGVAGLCVASCATFERLYYRVTRVPALLGRSHAYLTGLLLALTMPAFVPWYVPIIAGAFAIIVGKAVFGGVGHFVWQPALVGRMAVAVLLPAQLTVASAKFPDRQPVLARNRVLVGDIRSAVRGESGRSWWDRTAPPEADAFLLIAPLHELRKLTDPAKPSCAALVYLPGGMSGLAPAGLLALPPIKDLFFGIRPGGIGETSVIFIIVAGLYLVYRNYVHWVLPLTFLAAAWATAAVAPIYLVGPNHTLVTQWLPLLTEEGGGVGFTYVNYQLLAGGTVLAAFFLAPEMTSRPVATGGQVLFALGCGVLAMLLQLYLDVPIPAFTAVLAMNTLTPTIDRLWRPRVFGMRRLAWLRGRR